MSLNNVVLQWVDRLKYLGVWLCAGKSFKVDYEVNRTKFLSSVFAILQKTASVSEEIKWNVIQHSCIPLLLYGIDSLCLNVKGVHKLSVALNTAVRRCFKLSNFTSVRNVLYFFNTLLLKLLLDERKIMLCKSCLSSSGILRLCGLLRSNDEDLVDICTKYDIHYNMPLCKIKSDIKSYCFSVLRDDGLDRVIIFLFFIYYIFICISYRCTCCE